MGPGHLGPGEVAHAVHHVGAQDHQVLGPGPAVGLAVAAQHLQAADNPFVNQLLAVLLVGIGAPVRHRGPDAVLPAGRQKRVGLAQRGRQGLLDKHAAHPGLGAGDDHAGVAVGHPRTHADQIQVFLGEHPAVIGVEPPGSRAFAAGGAALGIGVGHSDQVHLLQVPVNGFQAVAVVADTGAPDDSGLVEFAHGVAPPGWQCGCSQRACR